MVTQAEQEDIGALNLEILELRRKQLDKTHNEGKGLTDDECRYGIELLSKVRIMRAGKAVSPAAESLSDLF